MITVKIVKGRDAPEKFGRLGRTLPTAAMKSIREISQELTTEMKGRVSTWRHYLKGSIRSFDIDRNTVGIKMAYYGPLLEEGGYIMRTPKLEKWARDHLQYGTVAGFVEAIVGRRAEPHPFIGPSIDAVRPKVHPILRKGVLKAIWRAGFRG